MTVLFVGPLPPPVHGFSAINQAMLDRLQARAVVEVFDRSTRAEKLGKFGRFFSGLLYWMILLKRFHLAVRKRPSGLYAGLSGGFGQMLDLPFFLFARLYGVPITLHHHSYAYLSRPSRLTAAVLRGAAGARHICLCSDMSSKLQVIYGIKEARTVVISNAAFMEPPRPHDEAMKTAVHKLSGGFVYGFLSNITAEKGIFDFFKAADAIRKRLPNSRGLIAGPVAPAIKDRFNQALSSRPWLHHLGPVYGDEKRVFYSSIDMLLFPTRYENEAEPVTILEALRAGVVVVAAQRGCIAGMLSSSKSCHCCEIDEFHTEATRKAVEVASLEISASMEARAVLAAGFEASRMRMLEKLETVVQSLCEST